MKKLYQKDWFGIKFNEFCSMNAGKIADNDFYTAFYQRFFAKYHSFGDLPESWKNHKRAVAEFISKQIAGDGPVLSIGCGLGYVESCLSKIIPNQIIAMEPAGGDVCRWLTQEGKVETINGFFPDALSENIKIEFAYSNAMDYVFDDGEISGFLGSVANRVPRYMMISGSFDSNNILNNLKFYLKTLFAKIGLLSLGQLWGFVRTRNDYRNAFFSSGFRNVNDGFLKDGFYWIKGERSRG